MPAEAIYLRLCVPAIMPIRLCPSAFGREREAAVSPPANGPATCRSSGPSIACRRHMDLLVIARDLQKAVAGLRSIAKPVVDTTSDFVEGVLAMLGVGESADCSSQCA
jgi:hypothetical protein